MPDLNCTRLFFRHVWIATDLTWSSRPKEEMIPFLPDLGADTSGPFFLLSLVSKRWGIFWLFYCFDDGIWITKWSTLEQLERTETKTRNPHRMWRPHKRSCCTCNEQYCPCNEQYCACNECVVFQTNAQCSSTVPHNHTLCTYAATRTITKPNLRIYRKVLSPRVPKGYFVQTTWTCIVPRPIPGQPGSLMMWTWPAGFGRKRLSSSTGVLPPNV